MRYGLLADIHESVEALRAAIDRLQEDGIDQLFVLGDIHETGQRLEETIELLRQSGVVGVWGNHDFGLCHEPSDDLRARFSANCLEFMTSLKPRWAFEDCLITHTEPCRDPFDLYDLWSQEEDEDLDRCFEERSERLMFHGHHHRWKITAPTGRVDWSGKEPFIFESGVRYVVQIGAVCDRRCGLFDTSTNILTPIQLA